MVGLVGDDHHLEVRVAAEEAPIGATAIVCGWVTEKVEGIGDARPWALLVTAAGNLISPRVQDHGGVGRRQGQPHRLQALLTPFSLRPEIQDAFSELLQSIGRIRCDPPRPGGLFFLDAKKAETLDFQVIPETYSGVISRS